MTEQDKAAKANGRAAATKLVSELRQPLTAARNYVGVARLLLDPEGSETNRKAIESLEKAELQIARAAEVAQSLGRALKAQPEA